LLYINQGENAVLNTKTQLLK